MEVETLIADIGRPVVTIALGVFFGFVMVVAALAALFAFFARREDIRTKKQNKVEENDRMRRLEEDQIRLREQLEDFQARNIQLHTENEELRLTLAEKSGPPEPPSPPPPPITKTRYDHIEESDG